MNLEKEEKIIYELKANINKTNKQILRWIFLFIILIIFGYIIYRFKETIPFAFVLGYVIITIFSIYGLIYIIFIYSKNKNNKYILTTKRVIAIDHSANVSFCYINDISFAQICKEKNNYGDLILHKINSNYNPTKILKSKLFMQNDSSHIDFLGIENPRKVLDNILSINNNIYVFDDHIKTIFNKNQTKKRC